MKQEIGFPEIETQIQVGKEIKAGERTLFPLIKITILKAAGGNVLGVQLTPFALLITEPEMQYAISPEGENMEVEALLELSPSLKDILEKARGIQRIRVE